MAKKITNDVNYTNIANAIREKNLSSDTYLPSEMPDAIRNIWDGPKQLRFGGTTFSSNPGHDEYQPYKFLELFLNKYARGSNELLFGQAFWHSRFSSPGDLFKNLNIYGSEIFNGCSVIGDGILDVTGWNFGNHTLDGQYMFANINTWSSPSPSVTIIGLNTWDSDKITRCNSAFANSKLSDLDLSGWTLRNTNNLFQMFNGSDVGNIDMSGIIGNGSSLNLREMFTGASVDSVNLSSVTKIDGYRMFYNCKRITSLDLSALSEIDDSKYMFSGCELTSISLPSLTTALNMDGIFGAINSYSPNTYLQTINLPLLTNVGDKLSDTFSFATNLTTINIPNIDTTTVTKMDSTFQGDSSLTTLDLSYWDTSNVTTMDQMFFNCSGLTSLDLSSFNISSVTTTNNMFAGCTSLQHLDIRNMDFSNVTSYNNIFGISRTGVPSNCEIIVKDQAAKDWVLARRSDFTNIVIA